MFTKMFTLYNLN